MKNLAGVKDCDDQIINELTAAGIHPARVVKTNTEVPYSFIGHLGSFWFRRAWSYWVAIGDVPVSTARMLYNLDSAAGIRVAGHAGAVEPVFPWSKWKLPCGREVMSEQEYQELQRMADHMGPGILRSSADNYVISDDPEQAGAREVVDLYHIDSQKGLNLFALAICSTG